jgi:hypothetical protein
MRVPRSAVLCSGWCLHRLAEGFYIHGFRERNRPIPGELKVRISRLIDNLGVVALSISARRHHRI